ncbi:MAG: tRNA pseudouridine(55) synthase TruB [Muribaculaceae bacterium]|nr:tRNA pseudouridine(55) synthase TruB [Muribaculaceae bacterium]
MNFIDGEILYIDKPLGWTSFDAVKRLRGSLSRRLGLKKIKVGHAGTLDPLATGVMILCTGRATKRIDELQAGVKEYVATIALGATTPSFDLETEIDATYPTEHITRELVESTLTRFTGRIEQVPPAFSACKVGGKRAYDLARKGKEVELKPKILVIDEIELLDFAPESITVRVVCSKGTYIRALARDIGAALGSGGHLTALRRTRVGDVTVDDCLTVAQAAEMIAQAEIEMPEQTE